MTIARLSSIAAALMMLTGNGAVPSGGRDASEFSWHVLEAAPADVGSPEAVVTAVHRSILGPPTAHFDFGRFRSLCLANGHIGEAGRRSSEASRHIVHKPVAAWVRENQEARNKIGLEERISATRVSRFDNIASVFYTHEVRVTDGGREIYYRTANVAPAGVRWHPLVGCEPHLECLCRSTPAARRKGGGCGCGQPVEAVARAPAAGRAALLGHAVC
jgi:hypothetical protein